MPPIPAVSVVFDDGEDAIMTQSNLDATLRAGAEVDAIFDVTLSIAPALRSRPKAASRA